jgi:ELWxxDGT repeat protein
VPAEPRTGWIFATARAGALHFLLERGTESSPAIKLWRSDGTSAGTRVIASGDTATFIGSTAQRVFFTLGNEAYSSDGTTAGTVRLPIAARGCSSSAVLHGALIFKAGAGALWRSDGTPQGTSLLATFDRPDLGCGPMAAGVDRVYFFGSSEAYGIEPWVTDGKPSGTKMLADLWPGAGDSYPNEFTATNDVVFFTADTPFIGRELWAIGARRQPPKPRSVRR